MPKVERALQTVWTVEEKALLLYLVSVNGQKWEKMKQDFPGRTPSMMRSCYRRIGNGYCLEKGRKMNRCSHCGNPKAGHVCWKRVIGNDKNDVEQEHDDENDVVHEEGRKTSSEVVVVVQDVLPDLVRSVCTADNHMECEFSEDVLPVPLPLEDCHISLDEFFFFTGRDGRMDLEFDF